MPQHQGLNQKIIDRYNLWSSDAFDRGCETNKLCQTMFMVICLVHYSFTTKYYLQFARLTYSWQYCRMNQFRVEDSMNVWRHSFRGDRFRQTETYSDEDSDICNIMRLSLLFNAELPTAFTLLFRHGVFIKIFQLTQVYRNESVCMAFNYYLLVYAEWTRLGCLVNSCFRALEPTWTTDRSKYNK